MVRQKLRIRFRKAGDLRLISHRDLARAFERLFRRAGLPLAMSQGFHPRAKINFPSALGLGIQGDNEIVETQLDEQADEQSVHRRLLEHAPPGLELTDVKVLDADHPKPRVELMTYQIDVPDDRQAAVRQMILKLLARDDYPVQREGLAAPLNLCESLAKLQLVDQRLEFSLRATGQAQARPRDVLAALGLEDLESMGSWLIRTDVHLANN